MKFKFKNIFKHKMLIVTVLAIIILPLIYAGLYLWAFWDPYSKLDKIPVAIVNEDQCTKKQNKKDKKEYCFGQDLVNELQDKAAMNWQFVDRETAIKGLSDRKYYTMATIPKDFSKNILSVDTDNPQPAQIEFKSRQASNFMAAKFTDSAFVKIKAALNEKISKEYFDNVFSETRDSIKDLKKAVDGASDLADGLSDAKNGSHDLYDGIDKENSGIYDLKNGLNTLYNGSVTLADGAKTAFNGTNDLLSGTTILNVGLLNLSTGVNYAATSSASLSAGQNAVIQYLNAYLQKNPAAATSIEFMTALGYANNVNDGIAKLKTGLDSANNGTQQLITGSTSLKNGLISLSVGISNVATGSANLRSGLGSAFDGSKDLLSGIEKIKDGQKDLDNGLSDAYDGSIELRDKLKESVDKNISKTNENKNAIQATVMSAPVDIHDISIDIVNNNGTGFAPYFISISLWVGSMAIFFLIDFDKKKKLPKLIYTLIISAIQSLVLILVLIKLLGLQAKFLLMLFGFSMVLSICFGMIQFSLNRFLKEAGKFASIILLMLQLTSSAGSYPLETAPDFFKNINPYLPMTYSVLGLREIISGGNQNFINSSLKTISIVLMVFLFINLMSVVNWSKIKINKKHGKNK